MPRVVIIVGMHRSGTSCLTGTLQAGGLPLGTVVTEAPHNAKGNRENRRIMTLHDDVLQSSGGSWDDPPERVRWSDEQRAERDAIIASYGSEPRWGFKDPRTLYTLGGWTEVLGDVEFVGSFRHPWGAVSSLHRRGGGRSREEWLTLWRRYNERLVDLWKRHRFPIVSFDLPDAEYVAALRHVLTGLELDPRGADSFFAPGLRHVEPGEAALPDEVAALYATLQEIAVRP